MALHVLGEGENGVVYDEQVEDAVVGEAVHEALEKGADTVTVEYAD